MKIKTLKDLRCYAISQTLFPVTTLEVAIQQLTFVQADPIRSPARAQDLILRHRVKSYCAGDLEFQYSKLDIEEDVLYAYGFMRQEVWQLLYPKKANNLSKLEKKVLDIVQQHSEIHPKELEAHFGRKRVKNAWGGHSKETKCALENLHRYGFLRVTRREKGIRVYGVATAPIEFISAQERFRKLVLVIANIFAPVPQKTLRSIIARYRYIIPEIKNTQVVLDDLCREEKLCKQTISGCSYFWPPHKKMQKKEASKVQFLAPFDPLVWDRYRFELFWGWAYRFEAYTPAAKRVRGYYAMPLLWRDNIIGWANVSVIGKSLDVKLGFIKKRPKSKDFCSELEAEIERVRAFLNLKP